MRAIGLDVHLEFCEVAIAEGAELRSAGRIATKPEEVELFAQSLGAETGWRSRSPATPGRSSG